VLFRSYLTLNESSFTTPNEVFSNLPLFCIINYTNEGWYVLDKNDFEIPSWWLRDYGLKKSEVFDIDYSRVNYLMLYSCQILAPEVEDEIEIKSIQFSNSNTSVYLSVFFILLLFNVVYFVLYRHKKTVVIPYVAQGITDTNLYKNNNAKIIVDLIAEHYALSDISVDWMYQKTKIAKREIASVFKTQFNTSFKEYLNLIRLTESKRLLKETSLSVSEIAYKVGYNNITHFNRVFKEKNGISPTEFREQ
jgi:AraC-like DNA-binding protein